MYYQNSNILIVPSVVLSLKYLVTYAKSTKMKVYCQISIYYHSFLSLPFVFNLISLSQNTRLSTFYLLPSDWKYSTSKSIKTKVYYQISNILIVPYSKIISFFYGSVPTHTRRDKKLHNFHSPEKSILTKYVY